MQKGYDPWPGPDEKAVIDDMLNNGESHHWSKCYELVERLTQQLAGSLPFELKQEIIQNTMMRVYRNLRAFKRESKLSTWLIKIVHSCKADELRKLIALRVLPIVSLDEPLHNEDDEPERLDPPAHMTTEQELVIQEELDEANKAILEYLDRHAKQERNNAIFNLHLDGHSQQEIAKMLNIPAPVVGYVIRSIQVAVRISRRRQPPSPLSPR